RLLHAVVRVQGESGDLDRDRRLYGIGLLFQAVPTVAAATFRASTVWATSCTRNIDAPRSSAITFVAIVPATRCCSSRPVSLPRKLFREVPTTTGRPMVAISSRR